MSDVAPEGESVTNPDDLAADGATVDPGTEAPTEAEQLEYLESQGFGAGLEAAK